MHRCILAWIKSEEFSKDLLFLSLEMNRIFVIRDGDIKLGKKVNVVQSY